MSKQISNYNEVTAKIVSDNATITLQTPTSLPNCLPNCLVDHDHELVQKKKVSHEEFFYSNSPHYYAIHESDLHDAKQVLAWKYDSKRLQIENSFVVTKMILDDFPLSQYTLVINGHNCATAKIDNSTYEHYFDFSAHKSETLETFIKYSNEQTYINDDFFLKNKNNFIDFSKIDNVRIISPFFATHEFNNKTLNITFIGYDLNKQYGKYQITYYPHDTYNLASNHPTSAIHVVTSCKGTLILRMANFDDIILDTIIDTNGSNIATFTFDKLNKKPVHTGPQNNYLSNDINNNTLNLSRVDNIKLIAVNCSINYIVQRCYRIYNYPSTTKIFSD